MELLLALPVGYAAPPAHLGLLPAHMAYRIGPGPTLLGIRLPDSLQGGLMLMDCEGFDGTGDPFPCASQILGECRRRNYRGIICDFDISPGDCIHQLLTALDQACAREGWTLHVPEALAPCAPAARVLIPSPLLSGTLERRLRQAMERYGPTRPVLAIEWLRRDIPLPAEGGGAALSQLDLEDQMRRLEPAVFFDRGLCAHYYTYMAGGQAHFVLFDTARSVRAKIALARQMGLSAVLMAAPELEGRWSGIFDPE